MEKHRITFLQSALDDLEGIVQYISLDSKENALKFKDKIIQITNKLQSFPKMGLQVPDRKMSARGYRMIRIDKYLLFYKIYSDEVCILRVLHGARDYPLLSSQFSSHKE